MNRNSSKISREPGEEFQYYVERQFNLLFSREITHFTEIANSLDRINERLKQMTTLAEQLGVEETTLAEVVPQLAAEISTLQSSLTTKEGELATDISTLGADSEQIKKFEAELAAIQKVQEQLAPVVEKAKGLVPVAPVPAETPATPPVEQPATPPAETLPAEAEHPAPEAPPVSTEPAAETLS